MYTDRILRCKDCGNEFVFTAGEQEFYADKGFDNAPVRCKSCRAQRRHTAHNGREVVLYEIVCAKCGEVESIPFEPSHDRPVYCAKCYREIKGL